MLSDSRFPRRAPQSQPIATREECCVCLRRTCRRTPCGHALCGHCKQRLRRQECPYCRQELPPPQLSADVANGEEVFLATAGGSSSSRQAGLGALRECDSFDFLHDVALDLSQDLCLRSPTDRQAILAAITRRCCQLLQRGWRSISEAIASVRFLVGLSEDGLLVPLHAVQLAVVDAVVGLYGRTGVSRGRQSRRPAVPRPSSASPAIARRMPAPTKCVATPTQTPLAEFLRFWAQKARLLALVSESKLILADGVVAIAGLLEVALRRYLYGAAASDLQYGADQLAEGAASLERSLSAAGSSPSCQAQRLGSGEEATEEGRRSDWQAVVVEGAGRSGGRAAGDAEAGRPASAKTRASPQKAKETGIHAIVSEALNLAERLAEGRGQVAAVEVAGARIALQAVGFGDLSPGQLSASSSVARPLSARPTAKSERGTSARPTSARFETARSNFPAGRASSESGDTAPSHLRQPLSADLPATRTKSALRPSSAAPCARRSPETVMHSNYRQLPLPADALPARTGNAVRPSSAAPCARRAREMGVSRPNCCGKSMPEETAKLRSMARPSSAAPAGSRRAGVQSSTTGTKEVGQPIAAEVLSAVRPGIFSI
ncbi:unnamed protein product [Polarella glacialis]|uniref:RING-type domain-containing protein n=1 Tax=Polarella glacialis TaxID=89957 RepID=A0A813JBX5_POLGL|nr:unnamed protein product [Polarella glacialis]CAE8673923.1 unnamed protein product [Polarella glacialis]